MGALARLGWKGELGGDRSNNSGTLWAGWRAILTAASRVVFNGVSEQLPEKSAPRTARHSSFSHSGDDATAVFTQVARIFARELSLDVGDRTPGPNDSGAKPVLKSTRFFEVIAFAAFARPVSLVGGALGFYPLLSRN